MSSCHHSPLPIDHPELSLRYLSAEHGVFEVASGHAGPQVGEQIEFIVGYSDSTCFLHDRFLGVRRGRVETMWEILGRGQIT